MALANHSESGGAIYIIFAAIALFGAVSWAMLGTSRTSLHMVEAEAAKVDPIAQADCANSVMAGLKRLSVRGCRSISFRMDGASTDTPDGSCSIYSPNGGGVAVCRAESVAGFCSGNLYDLALGEECGGMVYIGTFAGHRSYTTKTDIGKSTWDKGSNGLLLTSATSLTDGKSNTDTLVSYSGGQEPYRAALMCRALGPEWYLPSGSELKAIMNLPSLSATLTTGPGFWDKAYWSSTDNGTITACGLRNNDPANCAGWWKNLNLNIRCVRR